MSSYGIATVSIAWGITIALLLIKIRSQKNSTYDDLIHHNKLINMFTLFYSFAVLCMMISSIGALVEQECGINRWYGILIAVLVCFCCFHYQFKLLKIISIVIAPFLIIEIIKITSYSTSVIKFNVESSVLPINNFIGAILYYSYNMSILIPVLCAFHEKRYKNTEIVLISGITAILLGWLMFRICRVSSYLYPDILSKELPNLYIASLISKSLKVKCLLVLIGAIFTTALSTRV